MTVACCPEKENAQSRGDGSHTLLPLLITVVSVAAAPGGLLPNRPTSQRSRTMISPCILRRTDAQLAIASAACLSSTPGIRGACLTISLDAKRVITFVG
jgi:hypothetical protein